MIKENKLNYVLPKTYAHELTQFMHGALFSPVKSILLIAIKKGFLTTFLALTEQNVKKYIRAPNSTIMGHLDQQRKNKMSTKKKENKNYYEILEENKPPAGERDKSEYDLHPPKETQKHKSVTSA